MVNRQFFSALILTAAAAMAQAAPATAAPAGDKAARCTALASNKPQAQREAYVAKCSNYSEGRLRQYERMRSCNAQAKTQTLKGEPRKTFMKSCLSNKTA